MIYNTDSEFTQHGGNLSFIANNFPQAPRPFIDLSTGINPYAYPLKISSEAAHRLADVEEMSEARNAAASYYGTKPENINLASGMQPLMFALAALRLQKYGIANIAILSPTYSEYKKLWRAAGHKVINVKNIDELAQADVAIICNPNNPDGKIYSPEKLLLLKNNWLIVDESFADLSPHPSPLPEGEGIIVMRSCGKFFGIAGLRVSAAIAAKEISEYLRIVVGDWSISTQICLALPTMFADNNWAEKTRILLARESKVWRNILAQYFTTIGYTSLFTLVESDDANSWYEHLAAQGILVRKFAYNKRWLRFGLPNFADLERIKTVLRNDKI